VKLFCFVISVISDSRRFLAAARVSRFRRFDYTRYFAKDAADVASTRVW